MSEEGPECWVIGRAANPNAERGKWEGGVLKQITHSQLNGCYLWLGMGFSNCAAKMFRRWHFVCVGAVTWA